MPMQTAFFMVHLSPVRTGWSGTEQESARLPFHPQVAITSIGKKPHDYKVPRRDFPLYGFNAFSSAFGLDPISTNCTWTW